MSLGEMTLKENLNPPSATRNAEPSCGSIPFVTPTMSPSAADTTSRILRSGEAVDVGAMLGHDHEQLEVLLDEQRLVPGPEALQPRPAGAVNDRNRSDVEQRDALHLRPFLPHRAANCRTPVTLDGRRALPSKAKRPALGASAAPTATPRRRRKTSTAKKPSPLVGLVSPSVLVRVPMERR